MASTRRSPHWPLGLLMLSFVPLAFVGAASPAVVQTSVFAQNGDTVMGAGGGFEQPVALEIPDTGPAAAYPSTVSVSGLPGVVRDVVLILTNLTHPNPADLDVMLVSPTGRRAVVMSDVGGGDDVAGQTIHLDDEAATPLPDSDIDRDTDPDEEDHEFYQPRNAGGASDFFPAPAPTPGDASALSTFDGIDPNGEWQLYVVDDGVAVGPSSIAGGWNLQIFTRSDPYPSTLDVSGVKGRIVDLNVTLTGITHEHPDDIDILLVGPQGEQSTIISDVGGGDDAVGVDLTLDDEAARPLHDSAELVSGTYQPSNEYPFDASSEEDYPPPAPKSTGKHVLGSFDGTDPNGTWRLFVVDDGFCPSMRCPDWGAWLPEDAYLGSLSGWQLEIRWADTGAPSGAVQVEGGAAFTNAPTVTLNLSAMDPAPGEGVTRMRFSNDGARFSLFRPYAATTSWTLTPGDGHRTVYAQFADGAGNLSPVVSDSILLAVGPKANQVKPGRGAKNVKIDAMVKIFASEALAASTVTKRNVTLVEKGTSNKVKAVVRYKSGKQLVQLQPKRPLAVDTKYKVLVRTRVTDLAGNRWDQKTKSGVQPLRWAFTTR